jgi:hypothetical protein
MTLTRKWRHGLVYAALVFSLVTGGFAAVPVQAIAGVGTDVQKEGQRVHPSLPALWWQWVNAQQAVDVPEAGAPAGIFSPAGTNNTNPVLDKTGAYAAAGQANGIGPGNRYFLLAGTFGDNVTRTVTVPRGKILFFPIYNVQIDNATDPVPNPRLSAGDVCRLAAEAVDGAGVVQSAALDGQPIATFRLQSNPFSYKVPDENSLYNYFGLAGPQFEGTIAPSCTDGFWAILDPLPPGQHVLEINASNTSGFSLKVIYHLTVL